MKSRLPWPEALLVARSWRGISRLLTRCAELERRGSLPATLLLLSDAWLGREALAVELAALLTCRQRSGPGCRCPSCERLRRGIHPDIDVLAVAEGKEEIAIEQVREVTDDLASRPYEGRHRIVVVADAHTPPLNAHAASALLKTLEEPPAHAVIVLLASNPVSVLPTILSRAVCLRVPPPTEDELVDLVVSVRDVAREEAAALAAACRNEPGLAVQPGAPATAAAWAQLDEAARSVCAGDGLALLRIGTRMRETPDLAGPAAVVLPQLAVPVAVALLERVVSASPAAAEAALEAVAELLVAARRCAVLHLDLEAASVGVLAPLVASVISRGAAQGTIGTRRMRAPAKA